MALFKRKTKEEKLIDRERKRIHEEVIKKENLFSKEDKVPPQGYFVSLQHINKIYDNHVQAVYDFNLDIKPREFIVFVGPSGCGKSTTLRMIAGLEDITYGNLFINGIYANDLQPKDRDIAMVFQSYALYPHMTVFNNMAFGLKIRKVPMLEIDQAKYKEQLNVVVAKEKEIYKLNDELSDLKKRYKNDTSDLANNFIQNAQAAIVKANKELDIENEKLFQIKNEPVLGIDKGTIAKIKKDQKYYQKLLNSFKKEGIKLENRKNDIEEKTYEHLIFENKKRIKQATESLERTEKSLKYYETTKVSVYKNKHLSKREIKEAVLKAANTLDLKDYLDRKPSALSGGQCQRVALGRAIVRNSKLFLMDEPLSNLDAKLRVQMRSEIVKLHNELETTTIYVTHDQTEAMTMASRIVVMSKGHIQQIGTPKEIYNRPANIFVASFIGSPAMNIFDVEYDNGKLNITDKYSIKLDKDYVKTHDDFYINEIKIINDEISELKREINAYEEYQENLKENKATKSEDKVINDANHYEFNKIELESRIKKLNAYKEILSTKKHKIKMGIRPEDIVRVEDKTAKQTLTKSFKAKVIVPELLGHEYYVHFDMGGTELIAKTQGNDNIKMGDEIEFGLNINFLHLFDSTSTKLIK